MIHSWNLDLRGFTRWPTRRRSRYIRTSPVIPAWQPSRVTVLGDAVHAMSPAGGSGANTALRDAAQLCSELTTAVGDITTAISRRAPPRDADTPPIPASAGAETERATLRNPLLSWLLAESPESEARY